eukprot:TRINITY_DN13186_c0_g1_i1.p1 TRINITY_DN13186_c0_g1~~TRINITY_DN13186_c0_g1_i1.p1  ORF type:complete len:256 (-),score=67.74 TRINITY_DN13186_c0_g1_i1:55-762(-)
MGEGFGLYTMGCDEELMKLITTANIACGFHAGDPSVMSKTVKLAKKYNVSVGAHPSLPDLQGFGRREMKISPSELRDILIYQIGALNGFLKAEDMTLNHIKPHGALYGMVSRDKDLANAVCDVAKLYGVSIMGLPGSEQEKVANERGVNFIAEFFSDLGYDSKGNLVITRSHDAVDPKSSANRVKEALEHGKVKSVDGVDVSVKVQSVCVHSDTPGAVEVAKAVKSVVDEWNKKH